MILSNTNAAQDKIIDQADSVSDIMDNLLEVVHDLDERLSKANELLEEHGIDAV